MVCLLCSHGRRYNAKDPDLFYCKISPSPRLSSSTSKIVNRQIYLTAPRKILLFATRQNTVFITFKWWTEKTIYSRNSWLCHHQTKRKKNIYIRWSFWAIPISSNPDNCMLSKLPFLTITLMSCAAPSLTPQRAKIFRRVLRTSTYVGIRTILEAAVAIVDEAIL